MSKRKSEVPLVEQLYKKNLGSFEASGGFCDDDDQVAERREEIAQKRQRKKHWDDGGAELRKNRSAHRVERLAFQAKHSKLA
ncbi:unnamed protein product, partial [Mesorhabditis spiculigera]